MESILKNQAEWA